MTIEIADFLNYASPLVTLPDGEYLSDAAVLAYLNGDEIPLWDEVATATAHAIDWAIAVTGRDLLADASHSWLMKNGSEVEIELMTEHAARLSDEFLEQALLPVVYRASTPHRFIEESVEAEEILSSLLLMDLNPEDTYSDIAEILSLARGRSVMVEGEALITAKTLVDAQATDNIALDRVHVTLIPDGGEYDIHTTSRSYPMHSFVPLSSFTLLADVPHAYSMESSLLAASMVEESK